MNKSRSGLADVSLLDSNTLDVSKRKFLMDLHDKIIALQSQVEKFHNVDYAEDTIYRWGYLAVAACG